MKGLDLLVIEVDDLGYLPDRSGRLTYRLRLLPGSVPKLGGNAVQLFHACPEPFADIEDEGHQLRDGAPQRIDGRDQPPMLPDAFPARSRVVKLDLEKATMAPEICSN